MEKVTMEDSIYIQKLKQKIREKMQDREQDPKEEVEMDQIDFDKYMNEKK